MYCFKIDIIYLKNIRKKIDLEFMDKIVIIKKEKYKYKSCYNRVK